jgi:hypothetical protein
MEQWRNVVIIGVAGTAQFDSDLERAGRDGFEAVGITAFGGQLSVLLKKKVAVESAADEWAALQSESRPA